LIGQLWPLQVLVSVQCGQALPPKVGSVWARLRCWKPAPHDLVQVDQAAQPLVTQSVAQFSSLQERVSV